LQELKFWRSMTPAERVRRGEGHECLGCRVERYHGLWELEGPGGISRLPCGGLCPPFSDVDLILEPAGASRGVIAGRRVPSEHDCAIAFLGLYGLAPNQARIKLHMVLCDS